MYISPGSKKVPEVHQFLHFVRLSSFTSPLGAVGGTEERTWVSGKVGCPHPLEWRETGLGPAALVTSVTVQVMSVGPAPCLTQLLKAPHCPEQGSHFEDFCQIFWSIDCCFTGLMFKRTYRPRSLPYSRCARAIGASSKIGEPETIPPTTGTGRGDPLTTRSLGQRNTSFWPLPWILSLLSFSENILPPLNPRTNVPCSVSFHLEICGLFL